MAGQPLGLLALVLFLAVSGVQLDDGLPKWSQRSSRSTGGWIPIEAPCLTCRAAAEAAADLEVQASSDFASAPVKAPPAVVFQETEFLRPPPAPVRVQRQEASRPILDTYIENQRPPPPPIAQPTGGKQGRDHRFLYSQNPPRQQFQGFPLENQQQHLQHPRVVFPTHQTPGQTPALSPNVQPSRQPATFLNQQFQHQAQSIQQQSLQQQPLRPQKQIRLQGLPHDQFPLILPPTGLGHPHGFQSPQLQLLPVPHTPQPTTAQVNLQNIFQHQLQNQLHHQINQQLLGSPLASSFPPSAIGQQLDFHTRNNPLAPVNVQLVPQQQQVLQPVKSTPPPVQKLETTSSPPKPSVTPVATAQADAPRHPPQKEKQVNSFQANPEEDVEEEVQLLYVPVEALRQRDRVNKQVLQNLNSAAVRQKQKPTPDRQIAHSFEIKHFQNPEIKQFPSQNVGIIQGSSGAQVTNINGGHLETDNLKANLGQETIVREEKLLSFTPPRIQQFHESGGFQQQAGPLYPTRQLAQQNQEKFRFPTVEQLQQEEQQSAIRQQPQKPHRPIHQQFPRQPTVSQEENSQRYYQDAREESSHTFPPQTTSRPISTSPSPTYTTTQSLPSTSPAPYQPPLSVYMEDIEGQGPSKLSVDDVLRSLNGAKSVPVLERAGPNPPKVFVGPSVLRPPNGYAKFELPYLSMLDSNRVERKVDRLPFFVAPLSFQPPSGYAKIPFPAPHVGSVVVSSTPIASTTERVFPIQQSAKPSALPELVNSLQASVSPPAVEYSQTISSVLPFSSTPQPRPQYDQNQQTYQQYTPQQPIYQQQEYQQQPQRVENENNNQNQAAFHQQLINQQNTQEVVPQHQPLPLSQPHSFNYHSTPIPTEGPIYYSTPETTTTTTTSTTTALPQTRAPVHHSRGRTRQRPSYAQTTSSDSDNNYRNRGTYRGNSASESTRQPSTRTRRPWDGRRRPTTTPEPNGSPETYSFNNANQNFSPAQPLNDITPSTTSTTDSTRNVYLGQNIRETSPSLTQQQYSNDEVFSPEVQSAGGSDEGHLRNQGAVVLSAFQQPQVLGDVITGQIQRPDDNTGFRTYYGGQREYTVSTFDPSPNLGVSPTLPQVQSPSPIPDQQSSVYKGAFDGELKNKDPPRQSLKSKDSGRGTSFGGQKSEVYSNYQQPRGQKYFSQQNLRETEAPAAKVQQNYQEGAVSVTQGPYVESQFVIPSGQRVQAGDNGRFRNYHPRPSLKDQNQGQQNIYSTQFTPSIEISDAPNLQPSTPLPDISGVNGNQQPQYFIISTPIPNPVHLINRTYANEQIFESQQPILYSQVNQSPHVGKENAPVASLINEGLLPKEHSQQDNLGNNYKFPDTSAEQFIEESQTQPPKTTQATTTTQDPAYNIQTQEEPKRTRYRVPQRTYSGSGAQNAPEGSDAVNEERPRYRGHHSRYNGETRTRQPVQRTRGRHYTTESPADEEVQAQPQRTQSVHQRYRGRQRASAASSTSENAQNSESLRSPVSHTPEATEKTLSGVQSEQGGEAAPEFGINTQDVSQLGQTEEQFRKTERPRYSQPQISQDNTQDTERPVHSRGRTRLRGGDRTASRQRPQYGSFNNQESPSPGNTYSRNPSVGQRYQHTPRRNPGQEVTYQEPQRDHPDDTQQVALTFDSPSQKTPLLLRTEDETSYSPNPIVIESYEAKDQKEAVRKIQGAGEFLPLEVPVNQAVVNDQYEQPLLPIEAESEYQEVPTTSAVPPTTELTTTPTVVAKPGRKYGNFVRAGSPRRQSHATAPLNLEAPTTPPPENTHSNKVYTVRPARRPVAKPTASTRVRIRRPTTPTPTTTTTTTEPSYYLTTSAPINTQQENPSYDTPSFGSTRGGFRVRKRPVAGSRRPTSPASNEVNQDEQEEPARLQGGYRQRSRVPSRRLSPSSTERTAARWRQSEFSGAEEQQEPGIVSQSAQGFKSGKPSENADSYVEPQNNDDSTKFQISLSEEQLASHIPTKALRTQGKVDAFNQSPVYQSGEQYYSQESQQPQEGQENPLKYHNPPVRPSTFVVPDDTAYTYERSRPFSPQPKAPTYENSQDGEQQKRTFHPNQQDFVINFSGASRGEDSLYPNRDELESGQESRYFDKVKPSKTNEKPYSEQEKVKEEALQETSEVEDVQAARDSSEDSQGHSTTLQVKAVTPQPEELANADNKEAAVNEEPSVRVENRPLKKVTGGRRRGNWVRVRTKTHRPRPGDTLETAESQNLASVSQNVLQFTTPLKEKTAPRWLNTPVPDDVVEDKRPDSEEPTSEDAETAEKFLEATEPTVDNYSDLDLSDVDEEQKEDAIKNESDEDIFEDLENGDFTLNDKESLEETEYDSKEKSPLVPTETEETLSESVDSDTEESNKNASQNSGKEKTEEVAEGTGDSQGVEDKVADGESSTEQPEDDYDQQQETLLEKTEDSTEETGESTTDQPTPRVLGTSTTTEISLETEICYRGRCVKTKVDADQVPIE